MTAPISAVLSSSIAESSITSRSVAGQSLDCTKHLADASGFCQSLIGGQIGGDEALGEEIVDLLRVDATAAVEGEVPGDAHQPGPQVYDCSQLRFSLADAQEDVLYHVLRLGRDCAKAREPRDRAETE